MGAGIGSVVSLNATIQSERRADARIDEIELGMAHGRIAGSLFMRTTLDVVRDYDPTHERQSDSIHGFADVVIAEEVARLEALESRSSGRAAFVTELFGLLDQATAPDVDPADRFDAQLDLRDLEPALVTAEGRASMQLSTWVYLPPAYLALERAVADALINDRVVDFETPQDDSIHALRDGGAGVLTANPSDLFLFLGPNEDSEAALPTVFAAIEQAFQRTDDLQPTAQWLAEFSPFFEGGPSAIEPPPATVSDDLDAAVSLFIRLDRALAPELQRIINAERADAAQQNNRGWAIGIFGGIVTIAMLVLTAAAVIRRRQEFTLLRSAAALDSLTGAAELTVSIGCSSGRKVNSLDELAQRSDLALYDAKRTGRARSSVVVDADDVDWDKPSVAERVLADSEPTLAASAEFVRELVDLTQRFGVELTTSTRPGAHSSTETDGIRLNLILVQSTDKANPNRRFTDFPAHAGGPSSASGPAPSEQH